MHKHNHPFGVYRGSQAAFGERGHDQHGERPHFRGRGQGEPGMRPFGGFHAERGPAVAYDAEEGADMMFDNRGERHGGGHRGRDREGFGFGRGHGRPDRPLEQGDLRWLTLDLIAAQPRHGYEIIKAIEDMLGGHYTPSPGVVYPTLTLLEETGLITSEAQANKKLYSITVQGREDLEANAAAVKAMRDRIEAARSRFGAAPAPEMVRAMGNLRMAIQVRLAKGALSPESLAAVTAALDRAAGEIERS